VAAPPAFRVQQVSRISSARNPTRREPDEVVALGRLRQACVREVKDSSCSTSRPFRWHRDSGSVMRFSSTQHHDSTKKSETFSTAADNQTSVEVKCPGRAAHGHDNAAGKFGWRASCPATRRTQIE